MEQAETSHTLGQHVRQKMLNRLEYLGDPEENLGKLFRTIDQDGSGVLR